ncbi:MAG: MiaB/RimO family radical SAM methylthiotransferase [Epsilonproteobacteria bacterium]|nr:MiaB/RimO family radical SAM methylthiotransferase [Campylobacterota bacterium]
MNQVDTEWMREQCESSGIFVANDLRSSTIAVINSCAVTSGAEKDVARWVRKAVNAEKDVIVAGCITKDYADKLREEYGVSAFLFGGARKRIVTALRQIASGSDVQQWTENADLKFSGITGMKGRTRGFLKIEEGCSGSCSYCIIPVVRGRKIISRPIEMVIDDVENLLSGGYREIVLSGTDIGSYGKDLGTSLYELLRQLIAIDKEFRIRISSIGITALDRDLISLLDSVKICRHLHISLQSGSDKILSLMRRPYNTAVYKKKIENLINKIPDIAIGTDIIVGFPGEDDKEFLKTVSFVMDMPFVYLHPFSYSPRKGTNSYDQPFEKSAQKKRVKLLKGIVNKKNIKYRKQFLGKQVRILAEDEHSGRTSYYFPVFLQDRLKRGNFYDTTICNVTDHDTGAAIL